MSGALALCPAPSRLHLPADFVELPRLQDARGNAMLKTIAAFDRIGEENAFAVLARAMLLMSQGRDIINLGIGQPDFRTPDFIVEAAITATRPRSASLRCAKRWPPTCISVSRSAYHPTPS